VNVCHVAKKHNNLMMQLYPEVSILQDRPPGRQSPSNFSSLVIVADFAILSMQ